MFSRKPDEDNASSKVMRTVVTTRLGGTTSMCPANDRDRQDAGFDYGDERPARSVGDLRIPTDLVR